MASLLAHLQMSAHSDAGARTDSRVKGAVAVVVTAEDRLLAEIRRIDAGSSRSVRCVPLSHPGLETMMSGSTRTFTSTIPALDAYAGGRSVVGLIGHQIAGLSCLICRQATTDEHLIQHVDTVILSGNVHSWTERREAERAAWAAPCVEHVDDRLTVTP